MEKSNQDVINIILDAIKKQNMLIQRNERNRLDENGLIEHDAESYMCKEARKRKDLVKLYYYKGLYYNSPTTLYNAINPERYSTLKGFKYMMDNPKEGEYRKILGISIVYALPITKEHLITTKGDIIKRKSLIKLNKSSNKSYVYIGGKKTTIDRNYYVYQKFVDPNYIHSKNYTYFIDQDPWNCSIENLLPFKGKEVKVYHLDEIDETGSKYYN